MYPFGLKHKGYNNIVSSNGNSTAQKFGFGGKELQDELGLDWYDVTARNYDPALGRWMNLDPLAEKMRRHSPYNFGFNNPIYFQDYDGMSPNGPGDELLKKAKKAGNKIVNSVMNFIATVSGANENLDKIGGKEPTARNDDSFGNKKTDAAKDLSETVKENGGTALKGMAYVAGDKIDNAGNDIETGALVAAPVTGGASLEALPVAEGMQVTGKVIKGLVMLSEGENLEAGKEFGNIIVNKAVGKAGDKVTKTVDTKTQKKVHETFFGGLGKMADYLYNKLFE